MRGNLTVYERLMDDEIVELRREARSRLMASTAENIRAFIDGAPQNIVNQRYLAPR